MKRYKGIFIAKDGKKYEVNTRVNTASIKRFVMQYTLVGTTKGKMLNVWGLNFSPFFWYNFPWRKHGVHQGKTKENHIWIIQWI